MLESVYLCNLKDKEHGKAMETMLKQFGIDIAYIEDGGVKLEDYISGYYKSTNTPLSFEDEMIIFHDFIDEQIELVLDVFKMAEIPYIKYKVVTTEANLKYNVNELYEKVKEEYRSRFE